MPEIIAMSNIIGDVPRFRSVGCERLSRKSTLILSAYPPTALRVASVELRRQAAEAARGPDVGAIGDVLEVAFQEAGPARV